MTPRRLIVFWGTIHRMILIDLLKVFVVALIGLTGMIMMAGLISEAMKSGLGPMQILAAIPLLLPSLLPYTVPTTTLFATCIVYGRLSADNEILALKAAGIHIIHVVWPALILGIVTSIVTMFLYLDTIPYTQFLLRTHVVGDVEELLYTMLRKDGQIKHPKLNYEIFAKTINGKKLLDLEFRRRAADGKGFDVIARAREGELRVDTGNNQILVHMRHCNITQRDGSEGYVESRIVPVEIPGDFTANSIKARAMDMTWNELVDNEGKLEEKKQKLSQDIDAHQMAINLNQNVSTEKKDHVKHLINERRNVDNQLFTIAAEYHLRAAFSLGCLCFALVGCPIGIWFSKSDYLSAFITCFVPIVTVYYPIMLCTINLARAGKVPAWMGLYNADFLLLVAGLILFRRLARN